MADNGGSVAVEGNRAALLLRIRSLAPSFPAAPVESTEDLRWLLGGMEQQIADYAAAGFVSTAE